ncbi:prepilin-type N-terminal cleavage/methylation domain-containing protein [Neisseria sp. Dent CA1/247]|uniref:PilW family protein n=1 Tax=Neisseria sp. Dent CA1/247 TaxID=2912675 RepID=UPI001FD5455B|nr:prepilin-type N-terminal cleavage/methylation domain-containing protein [Neisseria sp. Dent CA1/247]UOO76330.1 prepilin-type N-terminal cleavage/methylation domain-containing protein [Neisseria sp. Dent CA1/247]
MKKYQSYLYTSHKQGQKGFSLIEFAVASVLSMIVLVAVSSGYFTARQLNNAADTRLKFQQDLRNAANMVVRDARMAGSFGCFNLIGEKGDRVIHDNSATSTSNIFKLENDASNLMPVRSVPRNQFQSVGFTASSDALVFIYGSGSGNISATSNGAGSQPLVFSSCKTVIRPAADNVPAQNTLITELGISTQQQSEMMVMNYVVNAYVTGSINGQSGLFRFQLEGDNWGSPQLLIRDVTGANFRYTYVNNCPKEILPDKTKFETFEYSSKLSKMPALIQMTLNGGTQDPNQIYTINASVRGGNSCANRTL